MVVFGLWLLVIFGFAAYALDVSRIYNEHSELRNGADAAALAIAADCAEGMCAILYDEYGVAQQYADANSDDGVSWVESVDLDLFNRTVTVDVATEDQDGDRNYDMVMAQIVGYQGATVRASATVNWGAPALADAFPLAFSKCEWDNFGVPAFADENPLGFLHRSSSVLNGELTLGSAYKLHDRAVTIHFHGGTTGGGNNGNGNGNGKVKDVLSDPVCAASPSGQDLPGGFGWLDTNGGCVVKGGAGKWSTVVPGSAPPLACSVADLRDTLGTVQMVPFFDDTSGSGNNGSYQIDGFGALYITGYNFGGQHKAESIIDGKVPCDGNDRCVEGYMIGGWVDGTRTHGTTGSDYGVMALELVN